MDAQVVHSRAGEVEDHPEKMSVMKKVRARAKKVKDSIERYAHHGQEQEVQHAPDDHDMEEEDNEKVVSPQVHDAPRTPEYDSETDANAQGDVLKPMVNSGDAKAGRDEFDPAVPKERSNVNDSDPKRSNVPELHGATNHGATHNSGGTGQGGSHLGETPHEYDPVVPGQKSNEGSDGPVSDLVPGQNGSSRTTGHEDLLGGARTKLDGPKTGPAVKYDEEPKGFGGGTHAPQNTPVSALPDYNSPTIDVDPVKTSDPVNSRLGNTDVLGEETPLPQSTAVSTVDHETHDSSMDVDPVVPGEKTNEGFTGPVSDLVPGQNRSSSTAGQEDLLGGARTELDGPKTGPVDKHDEEPKGCGGGAHEPHNTPVSPLPDYNSPAVDVDPVKTSDPVKSRGKTDVLGEETPLPQSTAVSSIDHETHESSMDVDPKQTFVSGQGGHSDQSIVNLDQPKGLEEDHHAPQVNPQAHTSSNNETNVTDPTESGGEETEVTPVIRSFDKMNLHGDDRQDLNNGANPDISTASNDEVSPDKPSNQGSTYTETITAAAISAKNAVAYRLGFGGTESGSSPREHQNQVLDPSTDQFRAAETPQVRGTIQPDHNAETDLKSPNQSGGTYFSSATSAITDRAISAKNAVASKLGNGPSDQVHDSGDVTPTSV